MPLPHLLRVPTRIAAVIALAVVFAAPAWSQQSDDTQVDPVVLQSTFLHFHPDIRFRLMGIERLEEEEFEWAHRFFRKSAYYGDKLSQAMVAEMLWEGRGVKQDRPLAYAWMDLAAERGYPRLVALRELFWSKLDEDEREEAIRRGRKVYAEFGDDVAKPRMENQLRKGRSETTGSRVGNILPGLRIYIPQDGLPMRPVPASTIYDERLWKADRYWEWQDAIGEKLPTGRVEVGSLRGLGEEADAVEAPAADDGDE